MSQKFPVFNFKCACCGECCYDVIPWTIHDLYRLHDTGLLDDMEFVEYYPAGSDTPKFFFERKFEDYMRARNNLFSDDGGPRQKCTFLGDDNKCKIYDLRPDICMKYSNTDYFKSTGDHLGCENFGRYLNPAAILRHHYKTKIRG